VLLEKVSKVFPSTMDFIDGDRYIPQAINIGYYFNIIANRVFRRLHFMIDAFLDDRKGFL
jgi:hypothetical protein